MNDKNYILNNEYFELFIDKQSVFLNSKPKEIQENVINKLSNDDKIKKVDEMLEYFYNFWKLIEKNEENDSVKTLYTLNININLVMINIPVSYFIKFKKVLDSLKSVIILHLKETNVKLESELAKTFFNIIFSFYTPIKPLNLV